MPRRASRLASTTEWTPKDPDSTEVIQFLTNGNAAMADVDKLNIDSIIQRLLEGKTVVYVIHPMLISPT